MKKLLFLLLLSISLYAHGQQTYFTPGVPASSTSFTPSFRFNGTDSLANLYLSNSNRWSLIYTAAEQNNRFVQLTPVAPQIIAGGYGTSVTGNFLRINPIINFAANNISERILNIGGFANAMGHTATNTWAVYQGNSAFFNTFRGITFFGRNVSVGDTNNQGHMFRVNGGVQFTDTVTFSHLAPKTAVRALGIANDSTAVSFPLPTGSTPTNGLQTISPDSIGLGGSLTQDVAISILRHQFQLGTVNSGFFISDVTGENAMYGGGNLTQSSLSLDSAFMDLSINGTAGQQDLNFQVSGMKITDGVNSRGLENSADYSTNIRKQPFALTQDNTVITIADSVKSTISLTGFVPYTGATGAVNLGSQELKTMFVPSTGADVVNLTYFTAHAGTLTSVATGYGLSGGPITSTGTLLADTTSSTGLVSKSRLATNLGGYVKSIAVTTGNGVSATSSGGQTPSLSFTLGNLTPTTISTTIKPATIYQTAAGTAGTDSVMVKHSGGIVDAISPTYYLASNATTLPSSFLSSSLSSAALASLTATDATLTFSGSFNGNTARTVGLNLGNADTWTVNGALSTPAVTYSGTYITGGTATTTVPYMLFQPTGTSGATTWSTSGTILGMNANSGFAGSLLNLLVNNSSKFNVDNAGGVTASGNITTSTGNVTSNQVITSGIFTAVVDPTGNNQTLVLYNAARSFSTAGAGVSVMVATASNSSGLFTALNVLPTYNQTSTAGATDFLINRTETAIGSGAQLLVDLQVGSSSKFKIDRAGLFGLNGTALTNGQVPMSNGTTMVAATVSQISSSNDLTAQSAAGTITSVTSVASNATYDISGYINVTAVTTDVIQAQITYTDENNTSQTISLSSISAIGNNSIGVQTIRVKASTTITLKTNLTTGIGSITFDAGGYIKRDY